MPVKIRLQRKGRKAIPYYHIVVADSRAPRDGKNIERLGFYDPTTNPATIELDFDSALEWLQKGAQPTDTCRAILSYKGVLYRRHLDKGVLKGALTQEQADEKFKAWMQDKEEKIRKKRENILKNEEDQKKNRLNEETKVKETRAKKLAEKNAELAAEAQAAVAEAKAEETGEEEAQAETTADSKEEPKAEVKEEKKEEKKQEPKAEAKEEKKQEPKAEAKEEKKDGAKAKAKEEKKEEK